MYERFFRVKVAYGSDCDCNVVFERVRAMILAAQEDKYLGSISLPKYQSHWKTGHRSAVLPQDKEPQNEDLYFTDTSAFWLDVEADDIGIAAARVQTLLTIANAGFSELTFMHGRN